jgi:hypothetical protein
MAVTLGYNGISSEFGTLAVRTSYGSNTAGGFLTSVFSSQIYLTGGMEFQGNTSQFIARATTGGGFETYLGTNRMYTYTGATVGNAVQPTIRFYMNSDGRSVFGDATTTANYRLVAALPGPSSSTDGLSVYNDNISGYGGALNFEHRLTASGAMAAPASRIVSEGGSGGSFMDFNTRNTAGSLGSRLKILTTASISINDTANAGRLHVAANSGQHAMAIYASTGNSIGAYVEGGSGNYVIYANAISSAYGGVFAYDTPSAKYGILWYQGYGLYTNASIYVNGTVYTSDARLKENIKPLTNILSIVKALNPVSFDWKPNSFRGSGKAVPDYGLIAQEVEQVIPEMVFESTTPRKPDKAPSRLEEELGTTKGVDYTRFIPFLIASVKELALENDTIKQRLSAIEG